MPVEEIVKAKYKCTQSELYSITGTAKDNLILDYPDFFAEKTTYDAPAQAALIALRTDAMNLPDKEQRDELHQTLRNKLPDLMDDSVNVFVKLQSYIRSAWPNEDPKPRYQSAGLTDKQQIGTNNWEACSKMNKKMVTFIAVPANAAALATPGGMPAGFAATVTANDTDFDKVYDPYKVARETTDATNLKITANNLLYDTYRGGFMKDGLELVYRKNSGKAKRYDWDAIKNIVSPPGSASLKVTVKRADDTVVVDIKVTIKQDGQPAMTVKTDATGVALFKDIDPGVYAGDVDGANNFAKDVDTGVDARITITIP